MLTTIMKYAAILALLIGIFWHAPANLRSCLDFIISGAAVFVLVQAFNLRKYVWTAVFLAIACIFNPVYFFGFSFGVLIGLQVMSAALFAVSLQMVRSGPRMTIDSITEANPRTESL
jgi:Family of unknown function (DUF6804)